MAEIKVDSQFTDGKYIASKDYVKEYTDMAVNNVENNLNIKIENIPTQDLKPYAKKEDVEKELIKKADKSELNALVEVVAEQYVKPKDGIPKDDLSDEITDSLDKADSALQKVDKADVGLSNVSNEKQATKKEHDSHASGVATTSKLGHIKVGDGLSVSADGKVSVVKDDKADDGVPSGVITMWSGSVSKVPTGWALCNGSNGTPNLRDRFVVGAGGKYSVGSTGGAENVKLTTAQMPSHSHGKGSLKTSSAGSHSHSVTGFDIQDGASDAHEDDWDTDAFWVTWDGGQVMGVGGTSSTGNHTHNISGSTANAGSGSAHENRPPYYALAYIMKL